jgi:hypothetical protein
MVSHGSGEAPDPFHRRPGGERLRPAGIWRARPRERVPKYNRLVTIEPADPVLYGLP